MAEDHRKFPLRTNEKYFLQKEVVQTKPSNTKSSLAANNLVLKSDQKHQKTVSLHKFAHSFINSHTKEVELSDESFSKPSINKSSLGLNLNSQQFNQIINEKKKAFNEKIPKTYRGIEVSKSPDNHNLNSNSNNSKPLASERSMNYCRNCKEHEDNLKKICQVVNGFLYEMSSLNEIEALWRNGNFSFENERIGSSSRNENNPPEISEDREFLETEYGKLCQKLHASLWRNRIRFEDLILDVENLSKMNPFLDIELKENKDLGNGTTRKSLLNQLNPNDKLMENLKDARNCLEMLKGTILKGGVSEGFLREIKSYQKKPPNSNEILQTLRLQLEQSLRDRRYLMIELSLIRKQGENSQGGVDAANLRKNIREIMEMEIKSKKNMDVSLSSSFNYNMM